jgi:hypothetical protein
VRRQEAGDLRPHRPATQQRDLERLHPDSPDFAICLDM